MDFDVFISYHTKSSLHITEAICNFLESTKIKCWYAPRNISGSYAKSIVEAINKCKIFLIILNKESSYSEDVLNEINLAVERMRKQEEIYIIPFHVSNDDISPDAKYYLGRIHWIDAINPPMEDRIKELRNRIAYILGINVNDNDSSELLDNKYKLKSSYISSSEYFIGRKKELEEIDNILSNSNVVALQGMGGIGKSELAKHYALSKKDECETIIFASYEDSIKKMLVSDKYFCIEGLIRKTNRDGTLEDEDSYYEMKLSIIREIASDKILLIIDNFDVLGDPNLKDFLELPLKIIITTRNDLKKYHIPKIMIEAFRDEEELLELFCKYYERPIKSQEEKEIIKKILKEVKGHTLVVQLLANLMIETRANPQKILDSLVNRGIDNTLVGEVSYHYQDYDSIYDCISCVFNFSDLNEDEKNILRYLSIFSNDGIEFTVFMSICNLDSGEMVNKLIKKSFIQYDYVKDVISLHPIMRSVVKNELKVEFDDFENMMLYLGELYSWFLPQDMKIKYAEVLKCIYNTFPDSINSNTYKKYIKPSDALIETCDFEYAEKIILRMIEVATDKGDLADLYAKMSFTYQKKDDFDLSLKYIDKNIKLCEEEKNYPFLINCYQQKAYLGKYTNSAKMCMENALIMQDLINKYGGPKQNLMYLFVSAYRLNGEYEKALEYCDIEYNLLTENGTKENLDVSGVYGERGAIYFAIGKYKESLDNFIKYVKMRSSYFVAKDFHLLLMEELLADAYVKNNELDKAKEVYIYVRKMINENYCNVDNILERLDDKIKQC